ncbi:MAG TPA: cytochrome c, partial [Myxococcota bacterium]|nr:cytochrome c [Myxococcota bacterium]
AGRAPTWPRAPDLRALDAWSRADFDRALRGGVRPDGTRLDPVMPWRVAAGMTDAEVDALWAYLHPTDR